MKKRKVVVIDWSIFLYMSAYASKKAPMPATYIAMTMILGNLKKIGVNEDDLIIVGCDMYSSWRKRYIEQAKADRTPLDKQIYKDFNKQLEKVDKGTDFFICKIPNIEYDDIAAVACRYYKDDEVILLSSDSDLHQLWKYPNVKIFSPHNKSKRYKIKPKNFNVKKEIAKLIMKKGHNNLGVPTTEEEYKVKKLCVDMINLPEWVEDKIRKELDKIKLPKDYDSNYLSSKTIINRYLALYVDKSKVITYEDCVKKMERKKKKQRKKRKKKRSTKKSKAANNG